MNLSTPIRRKTEMDLDQLAGAINVVELTAKTRPTAIRALAKATGLHKDGVALEQVLEAIEDREATAQTIVAPGFALPHALIDWGGSHRIVVGRSKEGVEYGSDTEPVHLVVLLIMGRLKRFTHLEALSALAELFGAEAFREGLLAAPDVRSVERMLREKAGLVEPQPTRPPSLPRINAIITRQAIDLVELLSAQALLLAVDSVDNVPWSVLLEWPGRLLVVTSNANEELPPDPSDAHLIDLPQASLARLDRANLGLLLSAAEGLLNAKGEVVCVTGPEGKRLDSVTVVKPQPQFDDMFGGKPTRPSAKVLPAVILRTVALAIELAEQGREAKAVGTMFVIGDARQIMKHTKQLVLNPFRGYSHTLRNLLDPSLGETLKEFAQLDGAFVIQGDGLVLSAGTYVVPKTSTVKLQSGLGTRHQAAAAVTSHTEAMAIVVSQSTGTVTVFRHGREVLKLERATSTRS